MMKNTLLLIGFILANTLLAQDSSKFMVFVNPYFTNDKNNHVYEITNVNTNTNISGNNRIEERMKPSYYNAGIDFKLYLVLPHHFLAIFQGGLGFDKYTSSLPYQIFSGTNNWEKWEKTEEISGQRFNAQYGIGKQFSFDKKKKLNLVLEGMFYIASNWFDKKLSDKQIGQVNDFSISYSGANLNLGFKCNMALNYQMFKHLGVGLALNDLLNAYHLNTRGNENFAVDDSEFIVKVAQLSNPVFSLVLFF